MNMKKWISVILVLSILNMFMVVTAGATYNKELYDTDSETIMQIDKMDGVEYYLEISNEIHIIYGTAQGRNGRSCIEI